VEVELERARTGGGRPPAAGVLAAVLAVLAVANVSRSAVVVSGAHLVLNVGLAALVVALGSVADLSAEELGLARAAVGRGLRSGGAALAVIAVTVAVAAWVPALQRAFEDERADIGGGGLLVRVLVVIPVGTVVVEELIFRGVVHGLLSRLTSVTGAVAIGAAIFGLWHVYPEWRASGDGDAVAGLGRAGAVLATFVSTTIAGALFGWLRARSGSLVAPVLAHLGTNTLALLAAWLLVR
jgi:uncharacterized protein